MLEHDTLAVLASGTGKTLIYHVAAKLLPGPTLVISPTIALQHDQLRALRAGGAGAALLNGQLTAGQRRAALADFTAGKIEFLLLAPEQLANDDVVAELRTAGISLVVIDEAHCVSDWGHDFRPDYLALASAFRTLGGPRVLALTATASPRVRAEIIERLGMHDPVVVVRGADRPNIWLGVDLVGSENAKRVMLVQEVRSAVLGPGASTDQIITGDLADRAPVPDFAEPPPISHGGPGIVYAATHRQCDELTALLNDCGVTAVRYHGGLSTSERTEAQAAFMSGQVPVIVATSAFGMGVDKPDVRFVFHTEPPDSLDAYYQEIGRAGRDGEPARGVLLYLPSDLRLPRFFASGGGPDEAALAAVLETVRSTGPLTAGALAEQTGLSRQRTTTVVNMLEGLGALRRRRDRRVAAAPAYRDVPASAAGALAVELRERQRQYAISAVEMMRTYAETGDCRRRIVIELLGEGHPQRCGYCDCCDRGASTQLVDGRPFPLGQQVRHPEWGTGTVTTYADDDRVVVLFDQVGYKMLALPVVTAQNLLTPA